MVGLLILGFVFEVIEVPFRQQDWTDLIYNFVGILAGISIYYVCTISLHPGYPHEGENRWAVWLLLLILVLGVFWTWRVLRDKN